jgi:hypothetical protein
LPHSIHKLIVALPEYILEVTTQPREYKYVTTEIKEFPQKGVDNQSQCRAGDGERMNKEGHKKAWRRWSRPLSHR